MGRCLGTAVCTRYDCFAFDNGGCAVLVKNCEGRCLFFKTRERFELDKERAARRAEEYNERQQRGAELEKAVKMKEKIKSILRDEFIYLDERSSGSGVNDRMDEVVQIYARIFNMNMCAAFDELFKESGESE